MLGRNEDLPKGNWDQNQISSDVGFFLKIKYFITVAIVSKYSISCHIMLLWERKKNGPGSKLFLSKSNRLFLISSMPFSKTAVQI